MRCKDITIFDDLPHENQMSFKEINFSFFYLIILCLILGFVSCKPKVGEQTYDASSPYISSDNSLKLFIKSETELSSKAGLEGKTLMKLNVGDQIYFKGDYSDFTTPITIENKLYNYPWLKVFHNETEKEGYIYAGHVNTRLSGGSQLKKELADRARVYFFGDRLIKKMEEYQKDFNNVGTVKELETTFQKANTLREVLRRKIKQVHDKEESLDPFFEFKNQFPGFEVERDQTGSSIDLLFNYSTWKELSRETSSNGDNTFFEILLAANNQGVEFHIPSWQLLDETQIHSRLGKGIHANLLERIKNYEEEFDMFSSEINTIKSNIIKDIVEGKSYWMTKESVIQEIDNILDEEKQLLSTPHRVALEARKKIIEQFEENNINMNMRNNGYSD